MATTRIADLVTIASRITRVTPAQILGPQRGKGIVRVRQAVAYVAAEQGVHSLTRIGRSLNRYHTTIMHARNVVPEFMRRDADLRLLIERLFIEAEQFDPERISIIEPMPELPVKSRKAAAPKPVRFKKGEDEWTRQEWEDGMRKGTWRLLEALLAA